MFTFCIAIFGGTLGKCVTFFGVQICLDSESKVMQGEAVKCCALQHYGTAQRMVMQESQLGSVSRIIKKIMHLICN